MSGGREKEKRKGGEKGMSTRNEMGRGEEGKEAGRQEKRAEGRKKKQRKKIEFNHLEEREKRTEKEQE